MTNSRDVFKGNLKGDHNNLNVGNGNKIENNFNITQKRILVQTKVLELLKMVKNSKIDNSHISYTVRTLPADLHKKMKYNNAPNYQNMFDDHYMDFMTIDSVISNIANSEDIVKKIRSLFFKAEITFESEFATGDKKLKIVDDGIQELIYNDPRFEELNNSDDPEEKIYDEDVDAFTKALMSYCVYKCKILSNPNEEKS